VTLYEVEANVCPDGLRYWKGHEEARQGEDVRLVALASSTRADKVLYQVAHVGEVEVAAKVVYSVLHTLMTILVYSGRDLLQQW
jgi:hypothetical protein